MSNEGVLNQVGVGVESTYGTATAPTLHIPILPSDGVKMEQDTTEVEAINTLPAKAKAFTRGVRTYPGTFEMNAYPNALGFFLYSALGSVASEAVYGESEVFEHVFTESVTKPSLTVEQVVGAMEKRYAGYIASGFNFNFKVGEPVSMTSEGMAKSEATEEKDTTAYETNAPLLWTHVSSISIGNTDMKCHIESINVEYTNGLSVFHGFCNDGDPSQHYVENSEVSGSMTMFMDGNEVDALRDVFKDQSESSLSIVVTGAQVGNASNLALQITVPYVVLSTFVSPLGTSYNQVTVDFKGGLHATDGLISVTLVNTLTEYAVS